MKLTPELGAAVKAATIATADAALARRAVGLLDLTTLGDDDREATVETLCARAVTPLGPVAAVCVWPRFVPTAKAALVGTPVRVATVVNFPAGDSDAESVVAEIAAAIGAGADEIDVVMPYRAFIDGARAAPLGLLRACRAACGEGRTLKVILESAAFPDADLLSWAARDAIAAGADFLKTSTGKGTGGATPEAAALMLNQIQGSGRPLGFKASGGIRTADEAAAYLALADGIMGPGWATPERFRFGASSLLDSLLATAGEGMVAPTPSGGY